MPFLISNQVHTRVFQKKIEIFPHIKQKNQAYTDDMFYVFSFLYSQVQFENQC